DDPGWPRTLHVEWAGGADHPRPRRSHRRPPRRCHPARLPLGPGRRCRPDRLRGRVRGRRELHRAGPPRLTPMATIKRTVLGTSDRIDLCRGFALFPLSVHDKRALQFGSHTSRTLLSLHPEVLAWRFNAHAGYSFSAGVCGPAFALRFEAEGETTGNQVRLKITNDET